jgi:hypothetical protein
MAIAPWLGQLGAGCVSRMRSGASDSSSLNSFTRSTDTMLVSRSPVIRTIQLNVFEMDWA